MNKNLKVSIITVVYNGASTIEKTINSVIRQDYDNIEYIIVDGASTDGTIEIINKYIEHIDIFVSEPDCGIYDAMNKGIEAATGNIVGFINSDDWYINNVIRNIVECFERTDAEIVHGEVQIVERNGELGKITDWNHNYETIYEAMLPHPAIFAKMSVFKKYGAFDIEYKIASDFDWLLRCYIAGVKLQYFDGIVAYFRRGGISSGSSITNKLLLMDENRDISLKHINKKWSLSCPEKKHIEYLINKRYHIGRFTLGLEENPSLLYEMLKKRFGKMKDEIIIFGAGIWGNKCCNLLQQCGVNIKFFIDNDKNKWGRIICGVKVMSPEILKAEKGYIFIAILNKVQDISEQLLRYHNMELNWVSIDELIDELKE